MEAHARQPGRLERLVEALVQPPAAEVPACGVPEHEVVGAGEVLAPRQPVERGYPSSTIGAERTRPDFGDFSCPS